MTTLATSTSARALPESERGPHWTATVRDFNGVTALTIYLGLLYLIPAVWVVPGLGAAGRPASLFGIGLLVLWVLMKLLPDVKSLSTPLRWILGINAVVLVLSYAFAHDRGMTTTESLSADRALLDLLSLSGVILVASEGIPSIAHLERLIKRLVHLSTFVVAVALVQFALKFDLYSIVRFPGLRLNSEIFDLNTRGANSFVRAKGSTLHAIEFAVLTALVLPLTLHQALHERLAHLRWRRWVVVGMHAAGSALAVSRTAVLAMVAAMAVLMWAWAPNFRLRAAVAGLGFLVAMRAAVPGLMGTILSLFRNWQRDTSVSGRTDDYEIVAQFFTDRPFFGRGIGTFIPDEYLVLDNGYLLRLMNTGLFGLATLLLLLFGGIAMSRYAMQASSQDAVRHLAAAFIAMIMVAVASAGTFDYFYFPTVTGTLLVVLGASAVVARPLPPDEPERYSPAALLRSRRSPWWHRFDPALRATRS